MRRPPYERNWRHVDVERLTAKEAELIDNLTQKFGGGCAAPSSEVEQLR